MILFFRCIATENPTSKNSIDLFDPLIDLTTEIPNVDLAKEPLNSGAYDVS